MNKMTRIFCSLLLLTLCVSTTAYAKQDNFKFNQTMRNIGENMSQLFPVLFHEKDFIAPQNKPLIKHNIDNIVTLFEHAGPHFENRSITFRTSYEVLFAHLKETQTAFDKGNLSYANNLLREAVSICTSCHTQDNKGRTLFTGLTRESFDDDYEFAEFSFMTRDYTDAIEYYDRFLSNPHANVTENEILTALKRELTIFAQVYNDPGQGADHLRTQLSKGSMTPYVKTNVMEWIKGLRELENSDVFIENKKDFASLEKLVHQYLGPLNEPGAGIAPSKKEKVFHVWLRGRLYHYLNGHPKPEEIPKLLYWLSINDRATNYSYYYSLADLYLQECMLIYTSDPYAKKCYQEYKDYVIFSYSGSQGTEIPPDLEKQLKILHKKVYGNEH